MIEQIAIACENPEKVKDTLKAILGADEWSVDLVAASGTVFNDPVKNEARLNFNYQLGPFEFELIKYERGNNWLNYKGYKTGTLSHLGFHIEDPDKFETVYENLKATFSIAQEVRTTAHTNPEIMNSRRYRYVIFDSHKEMGFDLKIIQRLNPNGTPYIESCEDKIKMIEKKIDKLEKQMIALENEQDKLRELS